MIAIAADRSFAPIDSVRIDRVQAGRVKVENAQADRTGSLRSIGDILGELLTGYDLAESALPAAVVLPAPVNLAPSVTLAGTGALPTPELALSR